jgi:hypothetical protein
MLGAVVDPGLTVGRRRPVVQDFAGNNRIDTQFRHHRGLGPSEIVQNPVIEIRPLA